MKETFEAMLKHMAWADRRIGEVLAEYAAGVLDGVLVGVLDGVHGGVRDGSPEGGAEQTPDRSAGGAQEGDKGGAPDGGADDAPGSGNEAQGSGAKEPQPAGAGTEARLTEAGTGTEARLTEAVRLYAHIVAAETIWLSRLTGDASLLVPVFPEWDVARVRAQSGETLGKYEQFLAECGDFHRMISYRTSGGDRYATSAADILTHVFLHGSYHRGQINARLRAAGFTPVNVDYITFVR